MAKQKDKFTCTCCGKDKIEDHFYSSNSPFHKNTGKLHVCKDCFWEYVNDDVENLKQALRMIDKPFLIDILNSSEEESKSTGKSLIKLYMKNVVMNRNKDLTWADSDIFNSSQTIVENHIQDDNDEEIEESVKYWGRGYSEWEYSFLEEERYKLMSSFECPDYGMEMIMKDICCINLDIEKLRQERKDNSQKTITNLIDTRSKLMNDANMKPIQSTGAEGNDQITFGTLIKKWENEKPIPTPLEDEMKEYIDTFMIGHLAKMEGLNNELTEKYDQALSNYTINFNEINKNDEDFED
ncbi:hypothetical protein [Heyndrickxia camelliae]|uniref:Uncharacterized protein n=1 Tax=Heyndrickxia camelliae TaxID=1707093 RepID=A0A2N3LDY5_9BACI|nr:hypothetical protein [Heyndrickxia camelliae]PKR82860.1 hypothetical protein CWO92_21970 [Heyndrickxia camelliae]